MLRLQRFESLDLKPNRCIAPQAPTMSYPHPDGRPGTPVPIRRASSSGSARLCLPETAERRGTGPAAIVGHASFSVTYSSSGEVRQREVMGMGWRLGFRLLSPPARGRRKRLGFFRASEASGATIFSRNVDLFVLRELITNWYCALLSFKGKYISAVLTRNNLVTTYQITIAMICVFCHVRILNPLICGYNKRIL